jgi:hypothetical protein
MGYRFLRKLYHSACCLAAVSYQFEVRAINSENKNKLCDSVQVGGCGLSWRGLGIWDLVRVIGVRAWILCKVLCEKLRQGISKLRLMISVWDWGKVTENLRQIGKQFEKLVIINMFISSSSTRMSITSIVSKPSFFYQLFITCQLNIIRQVKSNLSELLFKPIISSRSIFYAFGSSNYNFIRFFFGIGNIWGRCLFFMSSAFILSLTIYLTLLAQGIERQPGPASKRSTFSILTYKSNGLGDPKKLKSLLLKLNVLVNKGCIVFLQETHIVDTKYLEMIWKHSLLSNCIKTNSAGVIILYNKEYDLVYKFAYHEGRKLMAVIGNDERKFILVNAYFPNDHKQGVQFAKHMYTKVLEVQSEYPDHITFCAGNMNVCLSSYDSLNRIGSQNKDLLSDVIRNNNKIAEISDACRSV